MNLLLRRRFLLISTTWLHVDAETQRLWKCAQRLRKRRKRGTGWFDLCSDFAIVGENYLGSSLAYRESHLSPLGHDVATPIIFEKIKFILAESNHALSSVSLLFSSRPPVTESPSSDW